MREKRRAGIRQHYKSVMKFWQYDLDPECKKDKKFQTYQTKIKKNLVVENLWWEKVDNLQTDSYILYVHSLSILAWADKIVILLKIKKLFLTRSAVSLNSGFSMRADLWFSWKIVNI